MVLEKKVALTLHYHLNSEKKNITRKLQFIYKQQIQNNCIKRSGRIKMRFIKEYSSVRVSNNRKTNNFLKLL